MCSRFALGTAALDIQQVTTGALIAHAETVYEVDAYARIFVKLTHVNPDSHPWGNLLDRLESMIRAGIPDHARTIDPSSNTTLPLKLQKLERRRLDGLRQRIAHQSKRQKRGLFNFVGNIASSLFGIPSSDDISLLAQANKRLASATEGVVRTQRAIVAKVDILGHNQERLAAAINNVIDHQQEQVVWMTKFAGIIQKHLRIMTLINMVSDAISNFDTIQRQAALARMSCESRKVNEIILPHSFLEQILSSGDNHQTVDLMNYYGYLEVEKITFINGDNYCLIKAPLFSADNLRKIHIHTFPTCVNTSCVRIFQPPPFVFNSHTEDIFFPETCFGPQPQACLPSVKYDKNTLPCYHGLYLNDPTQLKECPLTLYRQRPPPGPIQTATLNRFVVETKNTLYHYRCPSETPQVGRLQAGTYVITLDPPCVLDASTFILTGVPVHQFNYSLPDLQILELSGLDFSSPAYTRLVNALPLTEQHISLINSKDIPMPPETNLVNDIADLHRGLGKHHLPWWLWLVLAIIAFLVLFLLLSYLRIKYKCICSREKPPPIEPTFHASTEKVNLDLSNDDDKV